MFISLVLGQCSAVSVGIVVRKLRLTQPLLTFPPIFHLGFLLYFSGRISPISLLIPLLIFIHVITYYFLKALLSALRGLSFSFMCLFHEVQYHLFLLEGIPQWFYLFIFKVLFFLHNLCFL